MVPAAFLFPCNPVSLSKQKQDVFLASASWLWYSRESQGTGPCLTQEPLHFSLLSILGVIFLGEENHLDPCFLWRGWDSTWRVWSHTAFGK